jgi:N-acyl-D-aspartate/D-glutamate deacylase
MVGWSNGGWPRRPVCPLQRALDRTLVPSGGRVDSRPQQYDIVAMRTTMCWPGRRRALAACHAVFSVVNVGVAACTAPLAAQPAERYDLLIRGGTVVDGSGAPGRRADVGIRGDRIVRVGPIPPTAAATRVIDAGGLVVTPGFIDPHTHAYDDLFYPERHGNLAFLMQGVTTVVTGNDGGGPIDQLGARDAFTRSGIGTNVALYVGHGTVRRAVLGNRDVAPTAEQLARMEQLVDSAMRGGALGLSTGLFYAPGSYATTDEVIALARVAARHGGIYDSHQRDESSYGIGLLASTDEAIRIGRDAGLPVHIAHLKALGTDVWGRSDSLIVRIERARAAGVRITADQYPYTASGTGLGAALLPRWAESGGRDSLRRRLDEPVDRARIAEAMRDNLRRRGGAASLLFVATRDSALRGRTLEAVAAARGLDAVTAAIGILREGDVSVASFNMQEADIVALMRQPWVVTGSDGSAGHPRKFGTFPHKLRRYVREQAVLPLERFVQASSAQTAAILQLAERGQLREGWFADVLVFDPARVRDEATYEAPERLATGLSFVLVNGQVAVDEGRPTGVRAGRVLSRAGWSPDAR